MSQKRIVIIGGVAAGMSCAARARRLSEDASIVVFERGPHPSFANCGLPYHIGGEIAEEASLIVQTPERLAARANLDVRTQTEVLAINRAAKTVSVRHLPTGRQYDEPYDALLLAPGAAPLRPPIPGIGLPGHFTLRSIPDAAAIRKWIADKSAARAVVVGGGYIGLEMAEQLRVRGLQVSLVERLPQVMAPLDPDMAALLHEELRLHGVALHLGDTVVSFEPPHNRDGAPLASTVVLESGGRIPADVVILGLGVRPESNLAREAGLAIGERGGIRVDEHLRTSDPHIYAAGDAIEVRDRVTGQWTLLPLAGPANRQGRIVADNMLGTPRTYAASQGTAILRLFSISAACTGANEGALTRASIPYRAAILHPNSHASYYPGAQPLAMKVLFHERDGRLLGAQIVGREGADKRIDVLAAALAAGMTDEDIAELELSYAPPSGSAKDPVNLAGMVGANLRAGLVSTIPAHGLFCDDGSPKPYTVLDVRDEGERERGSIPGSLHIPLGELRARLAEIPQDRPVAVYCASGARSYNAVRILRQRGYDALNIAGGWRSLEAAYRQQVRAA